jgi:hypothetical protein
MSKNITEDVKAESRIVIVFRGNCPKLSARGKGELAYELGFDEASEEQFLRISDNPLGGSWSKEWISLDTIEGMLENRSKDDHDFKAKFFIKAFVGRSSNNPGVLSAVLMQEEVILRLPENASLLIYTSFEKIRSKIASLKDEKVDLVDNVAIDLAEREAKKKERHEAMAKAKAESTNPKSNTLVKQRKKKKADSVV